MFFLIFTPTDNLYRRCFYDNYWDNNDWILHCIKINMNMVIMVKNN